MKAGRQRTAERSGEISGQSEATAIGEQLLVAGVAPLTQVNRLALRAAAPLLPTRPQKPLDIGLFDLAARNQLEMF